MGTFRACPAPRVGEGRRYDAGIVQTNLNTAEKQWTERLRRGKADQRFNTILCSDVADLVDVLEERSVHDVEELGDAGIARIQKGRHI